MAANGFSLLVTGSLLISSIAIAAEPTGSDIRAVIDGKYALTAEGYAVYQRCIANIKLGGAIQDYLEKVEQCKATAKQNAYQLPELSERRSPASDPATQVQQDRAWQSQTLQSVK